MDRAAKARGPYSRIEPSAPGDDRANTLALGLGTFVAPLPYGWSLHPARSFEGRIRVKEGFDLHYRIDSYEDAEAAQGGPRLLAYVDEPELHIDARRPADVLTKIMISIPGDETQGRHILWKWIDICGGTHVRELQVRCVLDDAERVQNRMSIGEAVAEWLQLGGFSPELTALDRVAHTATLERTSFEDTILMRVPRRWKVEIDSKNDDGRTLFAVEDPDDRETLWVTSMLYRVSGEHTDAKVREFQHELFENYWEMAEKGGWQIHRRRTLEHGDLLMFHERDQEERGKSQRSRWWVRLAVRDEYVIVAPIHLVTAKRYLDDPAQIESEALVHREVENAILSRPPRSSE